MSSSSVLPRGAGAVEQGAEAADGAELPVLARLRTDGSLSAQVRRGVAWTAVTRVALAVAQFGGQVVLMHLLLPADFGLVALSLVVTGFASLLSGLGLTSAIVQTRKVTERLLATAFWLNAIVGAVVTVVLLAIAPLVGRFYGEPLVGQLLAISALGFVLNVSAVPTALLQRSLRFRTMGTLEVVSALAGLGATIALVIAGAGAHALVLGPLVALVVQNALVWSTVRWLPRGFARRAELAQLWRFGRGLTGANLLYYSSRNIDTVLLGTAVTPGQLGLYTRSYSLMMQPLTQVTHVLSRVLLPAFSQMQDDLPRLRRTWLTTVRTALLFGLPVGLGLASSAPAFVEAVYSPEWLPMVPVLVLLSASLPPQLVARNIGPLYQALGRTGVQFGTAVVGAGLTVVAVLVGLPFGITGVATALLVNTLLSLTIGLVPLMRMVELPALDLWRAVRGLLLAGALLSASAIGAGLLVPDAPAPVTLAVQVAAGGVGYLAGLLLVERATVLAAVGRLRRRDGR